MRRALWLSSLLGPIFVCAELRRSSLVASRDIPLDESEGDLPPLYYGQAAPQQQWSVQKAVKAAEQEPVQDPEAAGEMPDEMTTAVDPTEVEFKVPQPRMQLLSQHPNLRKALIANKKGQVSQTMSSGATGANAQPPIIEEFDVVENGVPMGTQVSHGRLVDGEKQTAEDSQREQSGDFDKVLQPTGSVRVRSRSHTPQSLAHTQTAVSSQGLTVKKDQKPGPEKMKAQCMAFANYLKAQDVQGPELIRMWKGSCDPIVAKGHGGPSFTTFCSALGGALEPFVLKQNWPAGEVCDAVIKLFNDAGIGA